VPAEAETVFDWPIEYRQVPGGEKAFWAYRRGTYEDAWYSAADLIHSLRCDLHCLRATVYIDGQPVFIGENSERGRTMRYRIKHREHGLLAKTTELSIALQLVQEAKYLKGLQGTYIWDRRERRRVAVELRPLYVDDSVEARHRFAAGRRELQIYRKQFFLVDKKEESKIMKQKNKLKTPDVRKKKKKVRQSDEEEDQPKKKRRTIQSVVMGILTEDPAASTQDIIDRVLAKFPDSKINKAHVGWYRGKARQLGILASPKRAKKDEKHQSRQIDDDDDDEE